MEIYFTHIAASNASSRKLGHTQNI